MHPQSFLGLLELVCLAAPGAVQWGKASYPSLFSTVTILNLNFAGHVSPFLAEICSVRVNAASASAASAITHMRSWNFVMV